MENIFSNFSFDPLVPLILLMVIILIFIISTLFALFNKSSGIIYRITVFFLLVIIILQPSLKIEKRKYENDIITIVIDKTDSQKITNRIEQVSNVYRNMLMKLKNFKSLDILEIVIDNNMVTKRYGTPISLINNEQKAIILENKKTKRSNIIDGLERGINQYPLKRLSSIFILTDGQIHDFKKNDIFDKYDLPIYYLLIGKKKINDKKISLISTPEFGYIDEQTNIIINAKDFFKDENSNVDIKIKTKSNEKNINIKNGLNKNISIEKLIQGENIIIVSTSKRSNEVSISNNTKIFKILGIRKKLRVLLISGEPYMGTRVWRNFLKSDPSVELVHMTVLRPPEKNDSTPVNELSLIPFPTKELFEEKLDKFQLIIFDNFKGKNVLNPLYFQNIIQFVEEGGAVLDIAGPSYNSNSSLFRTDIGRILPGIPSGKVLQGNFKPKLTDIGKKHPITESLFQNYKEYGSWFQMNKISEIDIGSHILLSGNEDHPLLVIKKISDGRIAQIFSNNIWLWTKSENNNGGPYNKLIKNLAHWLMKEPSLEENKLKINQKEEFIIISKNFIEKPQVNQLQVNITNPIGKVNQKLLKKKNENLYTYNYKIDIEGEYIVSDEFQEKFIDTTVNKNQEYEALNISDDLIKDNNISNYFSKIIWFSDNNQVKFKEAEKLDNKLKNDNSFYLLRNNNFIIKELLNKEILNPVILFIIIFFFLVFCWRKESS